MTQIDFYTIMPISVLVLCASLLLLIEAFYPKGKQKQIAFFAAFGFALTLGLSISQLGNSYSGFGGMVVLDGFSNFLNILFLLTGLLGVALASGYLQRMNINKGEYYVLMMFSVAGMMLMSQATDLIITFLALELLSIPLYVLAAFALNRTESEEAGIKYFLLGSYATGFIVFGIALIFGATATTSFAGIVAAIAQPATNLTLLLVGGGLVLVGFGFKVATVPFHMWTPDVYQGAPTSVTAFMAAGAKAAGFSALLRIFATLFPTLAADLMPILAVLSALTMIVGNITAIAQTDIKRMLGYSSIAQAGYILMAFVPFGDPAIRATAVAAGLFYLVAYTITSFGSWGVVIGLEREEGKGLDINDYAGLGKKYPWLALAMTVFMFSLAGLPPTLGLVGKFYLFRAIMEGKLYWLALIGVITSLISAYYYLRVIVIMYFKDGDPIINKDNLLYLSIALCVVITVVMSFMPSFLFSWASSAILTMF
jgi:NADH-quinone oxidoreductase subunit N